jgi:hypothetical protein
MLGIVRPASLVGGL